MIFFGKNFVQLKIMRTFAEVLKEQAYKALTKQLKHKSMIEIFNRNMKKFAAALFAAFMLVSCGSDFVGEMANVYNSGVEKVNASKNSDELNAAVAETRKGIATILKEEKENLNEMRIEHQKDSTAYAEEIKTLSTAEAKFEGAVRAKKEALAKQ